MPIMTLKSRSIKRLCTQTERSEVRQSSPFRWTIRAAAETEGAQLLEFALVLPVLLVFVIGIIQFAGAYNLKQKMANGAREGARIAINNPLTDSSCTSVTPCAIQATANAVANYMTNAGVDSSCISPSAPTSTGPGTETYTYTCANGISITIDRSYIYGGGTLVGTQVILNYPYHWFFGNIIKLLVPSSNLALPSTLTESVVMQNLISS